MSGDGEHSVDWEVGPVTALDRLADLLVDASSAVDGVRSLLADDLSDRAVARLHDVAELLRRAESAVEGVLVEVEPE